MDRFAMTAGGDFRRFNIFPTPDELTGKRDPLLRKNKVEGSYKDKDDYLDVQIRLLREDFLGPWRQTLNDVRNRHLARSAEKVDIFAVRFVPEPRSRNRLQRSFNDRIQIQFDRTDLEELRRSDIKRFQRGSLVCLSADDFETLVVATIAGKVELEDGTLCLSVGSNSRVKNELRFDCEYELIENTKAFFQTYPLFLKVLQELDTLPFPKYLLDPKGEEIPAPKYLLTNKDGQHVQFSFSSLLNFDIISQHQIPIRETAPVLNLDLWPGPDELGLDWPQYNALIAAVTKEFAIIQGPPGTGKTFMGVKIVQLFLENNWGLGKRSVSDDNAPSSSMLFAGPIILLAHTNHALDQFLEAIIEIYPTETYEDNRSIFRIGGRSKSTNENLQRCILNTIDPESYKELKYAKIIAMTTSGAAKYKAFINSLQSKLVIVEEAAEILESHLVASIPKTCEHLILIGDHQQLRPRPASYWLETEYELGVSLFERLVRNNFHSVCLTTQRRMRPEIAELLKLNFYESLQNHESVNEYEDVAGIFGNLFFIDHKETEVYERDDNGSYSNDHEAEFLVKLCEYLLGVGYKPSQITILVTYACQERKIRRLSKRKLSEVRIATVDNYQGEENDIILLSLVRSNQRNSIGFLKTPNRVCVALSRARIGLYIFGNGDLLWSASHLWRNILKSLDSQGKLVKGLRLESHRSRGEVLYVEYARDFENRNIVPISHPVRDHRPDRVDHSSSDRRRHGHRRRSDRSRSPIVRSRRTEEETADRRFSGTTRNLGFNQTDRRMTDWRIGDGRSHEGRQTRNSEPHAISSQWDSYWPAGQQEAYDAVGYTPDSKWKPSLDSGEHSRRKSSLQAIAMDFREVLRRVVFFWQTQ